MTARSGVLSLTTALSSNNLGQVNVHTPQPVGAMPSLSLEALPTKYPKSNQIISAVSKFLVLRIHFCFYREMRVKYMPTPRPRETVAAKTVSTLWTWRFYRIWLPVKIACMLVPLHETIPNVVLRSV